MTRSLLILVALLVGVFAFAACGDTGPAADSADGPAVSGPKPLREPPTTPWGGNIFGLRVGLDAAKKEFAQGEDLVFTIRAENVSTKSLKLPHFADAAWGMYLGFQGETQGTDFSCRGPALDNSDANDYVLKPGEIWSKQVNLSNGGQLSRSKQGPVDSLPPDVYEIYGGYTNNKNASKNAGQGYWAGGHCWTNAVTITIR